MTLDIAKFITNSIKNQAKIQHLDINVKTVKAKNIPESVSSIIIEEYGDQYLLDANYVAFFWGAITKDQIKRLFNVTDKALGKSANKLTDKDFKKIQLKLSNQTNAEDLDSKSNDQQGDDDDTIDVDDNDNYDASIDVDIDDNDSEEDDIDTELNEDGDPISQNVETSYFFLKITTK